MCAETVPATADPQPLHLALPAGFSGLQASDILEHILNSPDSGQNY